MKKKMPVIFCGLAAALFLLVACSPKPAQGSGTKAPDVLKLSVTRPVFTETAIGKLVETEWRKALDKYMGMPVELEMNEIPRGEYTQRLQVYISSGEWHDIFTVNGIPKATLDDLGMQGLLLNLRDFPGETKNQFSHFSGDRLKAITAEDGGVYGFNDFLVSTYNGTQNCVRINVDVFQKHNLKVPETLDELYQAAKQLKALYPNSYPIGGVPGILLHLFLPFHTRPQMYYNGSAYVYGPREDRYRQGLEYLHRLYAEKLLDPEWSTNNETEFNAKQYNGNVFIGFTYRDADPASHPGLTLGYIPYPADGSTVPWYPNDNVKGTVNNPGYYIAVNAKTAYPALAMKVVDFQYTGEMLDLFNWGVEGITYTVQADGSKQFVPEILSAPNMQLKMAEYGINTSYSVRSGIQFLPQDRDVAAVTEPAIPVYLNGNFDQKLGCWIYYDGLEKAGKAIQTPLTPPQVVFTQAENEQISSVMTAINTFTAESRMKFITGEMNLNQWNKYLADMKAMGDLDSILALYNSKL